MILGRNIQTFIKLLYANIFLEMQIDSSFVVISFYHLL